MSDQVQPVESPNGCIQAKLLSDGRRGVLYKTIFGARILIGPPDCDIGGDEEYMFDDVVTAAIAFGGWDGYGEPDSWIRHSVRDQVRRRDPLTGEVRVERRT